MLDSAQVPIPAYYNMVYVLSLPETSAASCSSHGQTPSECWEREGGGPAGSSALRLSSDWCTEPELPSAMWAEDESREVEITTEHSTPQKPKHCSHCLPAALSCHHTPRQATTHAQGRTKLPSCTDCQTCKSKVRCAIALQSHLQEQGLP